MVLLRFPQGDTVEYALRETRPGLRLVCGGVDAHAFWLTQQAGRQIVAADAAERFALLRHKIGPG